MYIIVLLYLKICNWLVHAMYKLQTCFIFSTYPPFKLNAFDTIGPGANAEDVKFPKCMHSR